MQRGLVSLLVVAAATRAVAAEPEDGAAPGVGAATPAAGADSLASTPAAPPRAADPRNATLGAVFHGPFRSSRLFTRESMR